MARRTRRKRQKRRSRSKRGGFCTPGRLGHKCRIKQHVKKMNKEELRNALKRAKLATQMKFKSSMAENNNDRAKAFIDIFVSDDQLWAEEKIQKRRQQEQNKQMGLQGQSRGPRAATIGGRKSRYRRRTRKRRRTRRRR